MTPASVAAAGNPGVRVPQGITVLGSTGSIGQSTLEVLALHPQRFRVVALCAQRNHQRLLEQCMQFRPEFAVLADRTAAETLRLALRQAGLDTVVLAGKTALVEMACHPDVQVVMAAIVGAAGLPPTLAAAQAGKRVLLANKEALVMSGPLFLAAVRESGAELLPVDSEHNAIFQSLPVDFARGLQASGVERILLTASGGPFRERDPLTLDQVTPAEACRHPNWVMGQKISVDSATMMNKGLEMIEACWLFHADPEQVEIVIHPQSVVHSMVSYVDGSVLAQLGNADMRTPIAHALAWPERIPSGCRRSISSGWGSWIFRRRISAGFPASRWRMPRCDCAAPHRPCSMLPTKSPCRLFLTCRSGSPRSRRRSTRVCRRCPWGLPIHWKRCSMQMSGRAPGPATGWVATR